MQYVPFWLLVVASMQIFPHANQSTITMLPMRTTSRSIWLLILFCTLVFEFTYSVSQNPFLIIHINLHTWANWERVIGHEPSNFDRLLCPFVRMYVHYVHQSVWHKDFFQSHPTFLFVSEEPFNDWPVL